MRRCLQILVLLALPLCGGAALAWNDFGHMTVAARAWTDLSPAVRTKVGTLLRVNPLYKTWTAGVATKDRTFTAFLMAATWPDIIRDDASYTDDKDVSAPQASQNIGYADMLKHRYWHFIDVPFSTDATTLRQPVPPNARTRIADFRAALANKKTKKTIRSYDLVWLLHLVGDVHQPLHATSRFSKAEKEGDHGGNTEHVCELQACADPGALHAHWDDLLGTGAKVAEVQTKAAALADPDPQLAAVADEQVWVDESFAAAKQDVYAAPVAAGDGPFTLDANYQARAHTAADARVALAGARLARLLNQALQ